ncbi:MAG: DUF1993 domain-containing protein [Hyphomonadaceae bacterium]
MKTTLYDATVAAFIQHLSALEGILKIGRKHCEATGIDLTEMLNSRIYETMLPLRYQVQAAIGHSVDAIEGIKGGVFKPPYGTPTDDFDALQARLHEAVTQLKAYSREEINALEDKDVVFNLGEIQMPFTGEGFLLTFSLANMHFHATTAYDIFRMKGAPLGKKDYVGNIRLKAKPA